MLNTLVKVAKANPAQLKLLRSCKRDIYLLDFKYKKHLMLYICCSSSALSVLASRIFSDVESYACNKMKNVVNCRETSSNENSQLVAL